MSSPLIGLGSRVVLVACDLADLGALPRSQHQPVDKRYPRHRAPCSPFPFIRFASIHYTLCRVPGVFWQAPLKQSHTR